MRPRLAAGPEAREIDAFLRRPPVHPLPIPARDLLRRRAAALAHAALPPYTHALYGSPAPATVTRRLHTTGTLPHRIPPHLRRQRPPRHILRAVSCLGPAACPAPHKVP